MNTFFEIVSLVVSIICVILSIVSLIMAMQIKKKEKLLKEFEATFRDKDSVAELVERIAKAYSAYPYSENAIPSCEYQDDYLNSLFKQFATSQSAEESKKIANDLHIYLIIKDSFGKYGSNNGRVASTGQSQNNPSDKLAWEGIVSPTQDLRTFHSIQAMNEARLIAEHLKDSRVDLEHLHSDHFTAYQKVLKDYVDKAIAALEQQKQA